MAAARPTLSIPALPARRTNASGAVIRLVAEAQLLATSRVAAKMSISPPLLRRLTSIYKAISYLDFHGNPVLTTEAVLSSERVGEDWLLFFDRKSALC
jgi:hypothetical protein